MEGNYDVGGGLCWMRIMIDDADDVLIKCQIVLNLTRICSANCYLLYSGIIFGEIDVCGDMV